VRKGDGNAVNDDVFVLGIL